MKLREFSEFSFLCKRAGFKTVKEVYDFMKKNGVTRQQLYNILDYVFTPNFMK